MATIRLKSSAMLPSFEVHINRYLLFAHLETCHFSTAGSRPNIGRTMFVLDITSRNVADRLLTILYNISYSNCIPHANYTTLAIMWPCHSSGIWALVSRHGDSCWISCMAHNIYCSIRVRFSARILVSLPATVDRNALYYIPLALPTSYTPSIAEDRSTQIRWLLLTYFQCEFQFVFAVLICDI
jgi:hypothetical protein